MNKVSFALYGLFLIITAPVLAQDKLLKIYHDADYTSHKESAWSMRMGMLTALDEINNEIQGYKIKFIEKNHRGNSVRSKLHMQQFLNDPQALFMLGGLHSPPYIRYRDYINENELLLLVPWAAGGPITRYDKGDNWVFRLSIDDTKAGYRIGQYSVDTLNCKAPHLLLEDTPWGKSNYQTMSKALMKKLEVQPGVTWFNWNTKQNAAKIMLRSITNNKTVDCILFVGNSLEGEQFSKAMISLPEAERLPIISHWGITGGNFHEVINSDLRKQLDLHFIQTCFSFISSTPTDLSQSAIERAKILFPDRIKGPEDVPAPPGFIHAYDLGRITIAAMNSIKLTGEAKTDRRALRNALENLSEPVAGLIKTYQTPFSQWHKSNNDAHEALSLEDFCMAQFNDAGNVVLQK